MVPNSYELLIAEHVKSYEQDISMRKAEVSSKKVPDLLDVVERLTDSEKYSGGATKNRCIVLIFAEHLINIVWG